MNKEIQVIIPVVNLGLFHLLLKDMDNQILVPKKVIVINNTGAKIGIITRKIPLVEIYRSKTGMVNESLNIGFKKLDNKYSITSILNDDIRLGKWYFQRVYETLCVNKDCGVAVGNTCFDLNDMIKGRVKYRVIAEREGWNINILTSLLKKIPSIPYKKLTTFHGDDWIWTYTHKMSKNWVKDLGNTVYHKVGTSVLKKGLRSVKRKERNAWLKIEKEIL